MSSPDAPDRDLVDELLTAGPPTSAERIRPLVLAQTSSILRRRRIIRRLGLIATLAGCYLAGIVSAQGWTSSGFQDRPGTPVAKEEVIPGDKPRGQALPPAERSKTRQMAAHRSIHPSERRDSGLAQADFDQIRRVSDRYLYERGDLATSLHYCTRALDRATPQQRTISVETDNWLLMALKHARQQENRNDDRGTKKQT